MDGDGVAVVCQSDTWITLACRLTEEVVHRFGVVRLRVTGTSMVPSILPGDLVTVRRTSLNEISPGAVVLFTREGGFAVHRVVAKADAFDQSCLLTRGDRLQHNDPPVTSAALLGRIESIERVGRQFQPRITLRVMHRMIAPLLRASDRATCLYLRLGRVWVKLFR
jgi:signal peptidase I